ncbi:Bifunctional ligase/repressor BirA [Elizabethkingia anophelis]|uniref:biotin--[acetyl-CoA-carboxylase] ligase n=1 Tax=Elizabethkingia anophelis TaxID=1117645 RepID=UPI0024E27469|nr:biotin--[acetyl-CoA-carboxylase] ligase [Elizabethkingia anophelis]CAH1150719.1 Bifunctional ligase/repressor BirA [Elizabethkingia anophelis]CAI9674785.1 Bifunctional ligase/repressor BirA [Elizabethkingia anophelis]
MNSLLYLTSIGSTNDIVSELANPNATEISSVYTFDQTKGRGQYGNTWKIPKDKNVAYSFILPTKLVRLSPNLFNFYTALLLRDFIVKITDKEAKVKWPNDIILQNKKIVGILIEKITVEHVDYYIAGFGVNVLQDNFEEITKAGSIKTQTGLSFDLHQFAEGMHNHFSEQLIQFPSDEEVLARYNEALFRKDQISVFEINNIRQNGIIRYVDKDGYLNVELENEDEMKKFFHKEITLLY